MHDKSNLTSLKPPKSKASLTKNSDDKKEIDYGCDKEDGITN